ncbi:MAG TPA: hypothetical protein VG144_09475 [Gaiellaceae bacterium]|nr:hypothetical protein [Gaiellaceae bacterium]
MPQRTYRLPSLITRFVLLTLAAVALAVLRPRASAGARVHETTPRRRRSGVRRVAVSLSFATLFFAGAAFSAGAGDVVADLVEERPATAVQATDECPTPGEAQVEEYAEAPACESEEPAVAPVEETPAVPVEVPAETVETPEAAPVETPAVDMPPAADLVEDTARAEVVETKTSAPSLSNAVRGQATKEQAEQHAATPRPRAKDDGAPPVLTHETHVHTSAGKHEPELDEPNTAATIWLQRAMPDPTPPSKRLTKRFARNLTAASTKHRVHWSLVLGVLRARGYRGSVPATKVGLNRLAGNLARLGARRDQWSAVLAIEGRTAFADRTIALARYHRAVGLRALVRGLEWAKPLLTKRLLADNRVSIYAGGSSDLHAGRIDVRVIVLIRFLAEAHGQVTVSSLESGHRLYSRPGVVSAHIYGLAVDIAALGGETITGHNQLPGSVTEQAVRNMLLLPAEVRPVQVISLLGLGGPSFPMANHDDHIHAGF